MRLNIVCHRLPAMNNQPHTWYWAVTAANSKGEPTYAKGEEKTKKEALQKIQDALESLKSAE